MYDPLNGFFLVAHPLLAEFVNHRAVLVPSRARIVLCHVSEVMVNMVDSISIPYGLMENRSRPVRGFEKKAQPEEK